MRIVSNNLTAFYAPTKHDVIATPAVISAEAIAGDSSAEFAHRKNDHILPSTLGLHLIHKGA